MTGSSSIQCQVKSVVSTIVFRVPAPFVLFFVLWLSTSQSANPRPGPIARSPSVFYPIVLPLHILSHGLRVPSNTAPFPLIDHDDNVMNPVSASLAPLALIASDLTHRKSSFPVHSAHPTDDSPWPYSVLLPCDCHVVTVSHVDNAVARDA